MRPKEKAYFNISNKMKNFTIITCILILMASCGSTQDAAPVAPRIESGVLYGHTWQLDYMSGTKIAFEGLFPDKKPELTFDELNNIVRGNSGCNGYSATFTKEGDNISFSDPAPSTMMYCGEGEQQFISMMEKIKRYSVDSDGKLNLMVDEIPMLRFKKLD